FEVERQQPVVTVRAFARARALLMLAVEANMHAAANGVRFAAGFGNAASDRPHDRARFASRHHHIATACLDNVAPFRAADVLQDRFANRTSNRVNAVVVAGLANRRANRLAAFADSIFTYVAANLVLLRAAVRFANRTAIALDAILDAVF